MIAVVIPYYKFDFFENTLISLSNQTNKNFNIYIGDDASPSSPEILISKYERDLNIRYVRYSENLGSKSLVKQWQRCLRLINKEEWVLILGDDDVLGNDVIDIFYQEKDEIKEKHVNVVRFATEIIDSNGDAQSKVYEHSKISRATDFLFEGKRSSLSEHIFRIDRLKEIGIKDFPLAWHSDNLLVLEMTDFGSIYSINKDIIQIRKSDKSISGTSLFSKQKWKASYQFYYQLLTVYRYKFNTEEKGVLTNRLEKICLNNKRKLAWIARINFLYLMRLDIRQFYSFNKSLFFQTIKN